MKKIRILVVDDENVVREGFVAILKLQADMQVVGEAQNAQEAIQIIRRTACDAVVLDIALPGPSGLTVLDELKSESERPPILIMSMHDEELYGIRALRAGASGFLMKDSFPEELIKAIRKIASGRKYISPSLGEILASELTSRQMPLHETLSDREFQILCLIASGKTLKEIGESLCISGKTVSTYRARILEKMGMKTNAEMITYVLKHKLIE